MTKKLDLTAAKAAELIRKLSALPVTEESNKLVDELLSSNTKGLEVKKPIKRRTKE